MDGQRSLDHLREGCRELGLPLSAATELQRLLITKRIAGEGQAEQLGQSAKLDELLHWVLLNTDARISVEAVVGNIFHTTRTAISSDPAAEDAKAERRLKSMNAMSRNGWQPNVRLWEEPGTILQSFNSVSFLFVEAEESFSMYYAGGGSQVGRDAIENALNDSKIYCSAAEKARFRATAPKPPPAKPASAAKRPREGRAPEKEKLFFDVRLQDGSKIKFSGRPWSRIDQVWAGLRGRGFDTSNHRLLFDGFHVHYHAMLSDLGLEDGDFFELNRVYRGC